MRGVKSSGGAGKPLKKIALQTTVMAGCILWSAMVTRDPDERLSAHERSASRASLFNTLNEAYVKASSVPHQLTA